MYIPLDRDSALPLGRQISRYLEELIRRGHLGPDGALPATRSLARELGVSRRTVEAAYDELAAKDLVRVRPGRGFLVHARIPEDRELDLPLRSPRARDPLPSRAWLGRAAGSAERILDLAGVGPRQTNHSSRALRLFHEKALATDRTPLFSPPPPLGESSLRAAAGRHLARCGMLLSPEEIAILPGRAAAMGRLLRLFVPRRGVVLADSLLDPELALPVRERRARLVVLPDGASGRSVAGAVRRLAPRLLIVATGASRLPGEAPGLARRRALIDLARDKRIPIVEDVTHREDERQVPAPPPLAVLDPSGRVFPLCDLSDEIGGGFVAAALGATPKALERLRQAGDPSEKPLDRLAQRALARALDAPGRARARRAVRERRALLRPSLVRGIRRRLPGLAGHEFSPGSEALRLDLPEGISGEELREAAHDRGVLVRTARECGATPGTDRFLLLDLTRHAEGDLLDAIRILGEAFDALQEGGPQTAPAGRRTVEPATSRE